MLGFLGDEAELVPQGPRGLCSPEYVEYNLAPYLFLCSWIKSSTNILSRCSTSPSFEKIG